MIGMAGLNADAGRGVHAAGNVAAMLICPPVTNVTGDLESSSLALPFAWIWKRRSPGPNRVSASRVARKGWLQYPSIMLVERRHRLSCSLNCSIGDGRGPGPIVDQATPVGAGVGTS